MDAAKGVMAIFGQRLRAGAAAIVMGLATIGAMAVSAYGVSQAIMVPEVRRVPVAIKDLPPALEGFRLVQLTDLHISRLFDARWVTAVVNRTDELKPDLVVITGDLIDGTPAARQADVAPLAQLKARHGVFAITGNHEYYFDAQQWIPQFRKLGMQMLLNAHAVIDVDGAQLVLAGITDTVATTHGMAGPDLGLALQGAPQGSPAILLSHRPSGALNNAAQGVALQLSGHTHGGMFIGLDKLASRANEGFVSGLYQVRPMQLYVSNGTALWNGFPVRIGVPAEITEFTLHRAAN